ncbi:unnamed protein product [Anisakis simplex]|uniref:Protein CASC3 n=1 Tax=Anisakis simplex TaxID=6269 RepID=A0A0M3JXQ5_ANISI|nr:unnamed protein product [Anisakis simplex]
MSEGVDLCCDKQVNECGDEQSKKCDGKNEDLNVVQAAEKIDDNHAPEQQVDSPKQDDSSSEGVKIIEKSIETTKKDEDINSNHDENSNESHTQQSGSNVHDESRVEPNEPAVVKTEKNETEKVTGEDERCQSNSASDKKQNELDIVEGDSKSNSVLTEEESQKSVDAEPIKGDKKCDAVKEHVSEEKRTQAICEYSNDDENTISDEEAVDELDDDENVDNPAYIPKTGRYYMHDSRNTDEEHIRDMTRSRADVKWRHDRYDERLQRPKSRRELIMKYGHDIRTTGVTEVDGKTKEGDETITTVKQERRNKTNSAADNRPLRREEHRGRGAYARPVPRGGRRQHDNSMTSPRDSAHSNSQPAARIIRPSHGSVNSDDFSHAHNGEQYMRGAGKHRNVGGRGANQGVQIAPTRAEMAVSGVNRGGGKRYSTQRVATNYLDNANHSSGSRNEWQTSMAPQQIQAQAQAHLTAAPQQQSAMHVLQATAAHQPATVRHHAPPPPAHHLPTSASTPPTALPPSTYHLAPPPPSSDIVYFDPQQQLVRKQNPPQPRAKKRLEIVSPTQSSATNVTDAVTATK